MDDSIHQRLARLSPAKRRLLESRLGRATAPDPFPASVPPSGLTDRFPLSAAQRRLWLLETMTGTVPVYNNPVLFRLQGPLNRTALRQAIDALAERQSILRMAIGADNGQPVMVLRPPGPEDLVVSDLADRTTEERDPQVQAIIERDVRTPFQPTTGPLVRWHLIRLAPECHYLLVVAHHLVLDGWSKTVLQKELASLYDTISSASPLAHPAPVIQYGDFAAWQQGLAAHPRWQSQLEYWQRHLNDTPVVRLPGDRPYPVEQTFSGGRHEFTVPLEVQARLTPLARTDGVTLFMVLLGALQVLIARVTDSTDIPVGTTVAGRRQVEVEPLIGTFTNTLVMRLDLSGDPSVREILRRVRRGALDAWEHQDVPFEEVVEVTRPPRDPGTTPLFQVMFQLRNFPGGDAATSPLRWDRVPVDTGLAPFDLTLEFEHRPGGLTGTMIYNRDIFDPGTIERFGRYYRNLLAAMAADPDCPLSRLPLMDERETAHVIAGWDGPRTTYPRDRSLADLVVESAERHAGRPALEFTDMSLDYRGLLRQADHLATCLRETGLQPGDVAGICLDRTAEAIVAGLAVLLAGGICLPLPPDTPPRRLTFMLADARARLLVSRSMFTDRLTGHTTPILFLDRLATPPAAVPRPEPVTGISAASPAGIIYTSGTTGHPKGVPVTHRAIVRQLRAVDFMPLGPDDRMGQAFDLGFDGSMVEIWGALINGACLVGIPRDVLIAPAGLAAFIRRLHLTRLFLPTAIFHHTARQEPGAFQPLRQLLFGGETADPRIVRLVLDSGPPARLINAYGPTENGIVSTWYEIPADASETDPVPIGRPLPHTRVALLDRYGNPVPPGAGGEICLGGDGLTPGYLNRPELDEGRFFPDPFSGSPGRRLYRSGDRGRYRHDGILEFLGRDDGQIKLRGVRIEPSEVEQVLRSHPDIHSAAVVPFTDESGHPALAAWLVPVDGASPSPDAIRAYSRQHLPGSMVPARWALTATLPLTPSGKIDRRELTARCAAIDAGRSASQPPRDDLEERLLSIWCQILGQPELGITADFFDHGGHSLLAVSLFNRMESVLGVRPPLATLFSAPTVELMADVIRGNHGPSGPSFLVPLRNGADLSPLVLVHNIAGEVVNYLPLTRNLRTNRPVVGLKAPECEGRYREFNSVTELAAHYITGLKHHQPHGPYLLGGHSSGGIIALEMAVQMSAAGDDVPLVALLDTHPLHEGAPRERIGSPRMIKQFLGNIGPWYRNRRWQRRAAPTLDPAPASDGPFRGRQAWVNQLDPRRQDYFVEHMRLLTSHSPRHYSGRVLLFRAGATGLFHPQPANFHWNHYLDRLDIITVPGFHENLLRPPQVIHLASRLDEYLDQEV